MKRCKVISQNDDSALLTLQHVVGQDGEIRRQEPFKKQNKKKQNTFIQALELESFQFMLGINTSHI